MATPRSNLILASLSLLLALLTFAGRPWEPNASTEPFEPVESVPEMPDPQLLKRSSGAFQAGALLLRLGKYAQAHDVFTQALSIDPDLIEARLCRARTSLALGFLDWKRPLIEEAMGDVKQVLILDPSHANARSLEKLLSGLLQRMRPKVSQ